MGRRRLTLVLRVGFHIPPESRLDAQIREYNATAASAGEFRVKTRADAYYAGWMDDELAALMSLPCIDSAAGGLPNMERGRRARATR